MEGALIDRVLAHPAVQAIDVSQLEGWQDLGRVFVRAFNDKGQRYPIDFDNAYVWLQYGRKDSALRALKCRLGEVTDYIIILGKNQESKSENRGPAPDKYYLTMEAFFMFALRASGERGDIVRRFFIAVREAYFETIQELEDNPNTPARVTLDRHEKFVDGQLMELGKECSKAIRVEAQVRDRLASKLVGARTEVRCEYGMIDILTDTEVIEVKVYHKWKHALGQCLSYGLSFSDRQIRIHLFANFSDWDDANKQRGAILEICSKFGVKVTLERLEAAPSVSTLRAINPAGNCNCSADMEVALADRVLAHPAVQAIDVSQLDGWEELGKVFVKCFDEKGQCYPIDFDDAYVWLQYGRKDGALRSMKARCTEGADYTYVPGGVQRDGEGVYVAFQPDKYYLTVDAFERFAMAAQTEAGERVRAFFRAIRDAYLELTASGPQPAIISPEDPLLPKKQGVLFNGTEVLLAKEKTRQLEIEANARVCIAEMDHEYRMATLSPKPPRKRSRTSAGDRQDVQGTSEDVQEPSDQQLAPQAPHPRSTAAVEAVIKHFVAEHCTVDSTEIVASSSFLERLVATMYEGQRAPSARAVGVVMHKLGYEGYRYFARLMFADLLTSVQLELIKAVLFAITPALPRGSLTFP
ncbi:hypothetical protein KFL_007380050 [Klebsormidium nitens]|uniref:Uncharacterized protein n=1 Tax=Klebsormidium nitens TaxID=105231 RepID=A0A1Y1IPN2_KLENI|nr:hypothetical protein KFL_007380050 [Klebsormidium nitens]|eukprot:GAQ91171.1 hypothetical protein KFL_007380050 [Klebsormidium nitens]